MWIYVCIVHSEWLASHPAAALKQNNKTAYKIKGEPTPHCRHYSHYYQCLYDGLIIMWWQNAHCNSSTVLNITILMVTWQ